MQLKLYDRLPDRVTVNGKQYKCDFDFRNILRMMDIMQREDLLPESRDYLCVRCVCRISHRMPPRTVSEIYNGINALLFEKAPEGDAKRITSFEQDAGLIRSAFRQEYGIDLFRENLHWFEFTELLQNLPDGNRYEEVLGIRSRPLPAPTKYNAKEREWLLKAKQSVALHLTESEQAKKYEKDVSKIFSGIFGMIKKAEAQAEAQKEVNEHGK